MITGGLILNGVACGMIYRPLEAIQRKVDTAVDRGREANVPRSVIFRRIIEDKQRRRTTSTRSLDGMMITKDNCVVTVEMTVANSLQLAIPERSGEEDPNSSAKQVSSILTVYITILCSFFIHIFCFFTIYDSQLIVAM